METYYIKYRGIVLIIIVGFLTYMTFDYFSKRVDKFIPISTMDRKYPEMSKEDKEIHEIFDRCNAGMPEQGVTYERLREWYHYDFKPCVMYEMRKKYRHTEAKE